MSRQCKEHKRRYKRDYHKEHRAEQRDTVVYLAQEIACGLTRSDTGNKSAVLLNILRNVLGIELDLRVEIREAQNQYRKEHVVDGSTRSHITSVPSVCRGALKEQRDYHLREHKQRGREDYRHNAASVDSDRNVGGLTAVHFVSLDLLGVLNGNSSLRAVDKDDEKELVEKLVGLGFNVEISDGYMLLYYEEYISYPYFRRVLARAVR